MPFRSVWPFSSSICIVDGITAGAKRRVQPERNINKMHENERFDSAEMSRMRHSVAHNNTDNIKCPLTQHIQFDFVGAGAGACFGWIQICYAARVDLFVVRLHRFNVQLGEWAGWIVINCYSSGTASKKVNVCKSN